MEAQDQVRDPLEYEAQRDLFQFCLTTDLLNEKERASTLRNIVHSAFREGTFDVFAEIYEGDAWEEFVGSKSSAEQLEIVQRSLSYAQYPAYTFADRFTDNMQPSDRTKAYETLGMLAARAGNVYDMYRYQPDANDRLEETLGYAFIGQERWDEFRDLASYDRLAPYTMLHAATATAEAGRFDDALTYLKHVVDKNLAPRQRSDPDTGSWLKDALSKITLSAFEHNQLTIITELPTVINWPDDVEADSVVNDGVHTAARITGNHDAAVIHYVDVALRAGEDTEAYTTLLRAMEENNWNAITLLAPQFNSEVLSALQAKARDENNMEATKELFATAQQRGKYQGHEIVFTDDAFPLIEDLAESGDWEQALALLPSASKFWFDELMVSLGNKAVAQDRADLLPRLMETVDVGPFYLERFLDILLAARKFDEADALYSSLCDRFDALPEQIRQRLGDDLLFIKMHLMKDKAQCAVLDGNYADARRYLEQLGNYIPVLATTREVGFRTDARAFELIGSMILEKMSDL
jgi:tetratricopeptide (TPR) repeat protein